MDPAKPDRLAGKVQEPAWDPDWPKLIEPRISSRTLQWALEAKYAQNQRLLSQMIQLVKQSAAHRKLVVREANTLRFGLRRVITSVEHAVVFLGAAGIRKLLERIYGPENLTDLRDHHIDSREPPTPRPPHFRNYLRSDL